MVAGLVSLGAVLLAQSPARAATPLATPTNVQATHIADTSADLYWLRDSGAAQDVVERQLNGVWQEYARGLTGALALTGLSAGSTYTFRVYSIPYPGLGLTDSARSAPVTVTTLPGPDQTPPSTPPAPVFSSATTTSVNVSWGEATDNVAVTGYSLQQLVSGSWVTIRTVAATARFQSVTGLTPGTATSFAVIAVDARGNTSPRSAPGTVTTLATTPALTCHAQVLAFSPGFQVTLTILNSTTVATTTWSIGFTLAPAAVVGSAFNGLLTRSGAAGTITPLAYDAVINPGGQLFVGFGGSATPFTPPGSFMLNGIPCT